MIELKNEKPLTVYLVVDVQAERYEALMAEIVGMKKQQENTVRSLAELRAGSTAANSTNGDDGVSFDSRSIAEFHRAFDALKTDFDRVQST